MHFESHFKENVNYFLANQAYILYLQSQNKGSLAQLVQSICLTSRGSLVRTQ
jgi:hypothetical protein